MNYNLIVELLFFVTLIIFVICNILFFKIIGYIKNKYPKILEKRGIKHKVNFLNIQFDLFSQWKIIPLYYKVSFTNKLNLDENLQKSIRVYHIFVILAIILFTALIIAILIIK